LSLLNSSQPARRDQRVSIFLFVLWGNAMKIRLGRLGALAILSIGFTAAAAPPATKIWITMGDAAFQQVRGLVPGLVEVEARRLNAAGATDTLHALTLNETRLDALAGAIHQRAGQCGGFMVHQTQAQARAALRRHPAVESHPSYAVDNQALVEPLLAQMQEKNIEETILALSRFPNRYYTTQPGADASDWLMATWSGIGAGRADISVRQVVHPGWRQKSVVATIAGSDRPDEALVLGAHLDSILLSRMSESAVAPGADDDASGVAGITEALRAMVGQGYRPKRTIHLIAYAAEEVGLRGSQQIAREFKQSGSKVVGVLQLDMTNYRGAANDIYLFTDYTDSQQNEFLARLIGAYLPGLTIGYDKCGYACSDHASWQALGIPTSMPFESSFARDNPYIHSARDTYANSGAQAAHPLKFARLAAAFAVELGSD
jgi:leucyl aminopeptidase